MSFVNIAQSFALKATIMLILYIFAVFYYVHSSYNELLMGRKTSNVLCIAIKLMIYAYVFCDFNSEHKFLN